MPGVLGGDGGGGTMCPDYNGLAANELIVFYRSLYELDQYVTRKL